jgi:ABC-type oligopeptide transport system substrate-binding subunit
VAVDDHTLRIELEQPCGYFLQLLAMAALPVPKHALENHGETWTEPENLVTNGPFRILSQNDGGSYLLGRNSNYHGHFDGNLESVELTYYEKDELLPLYQADSLDILLLQGFEKSDIRDALKADTADYLICPEYNTQYIGFNIDHPPFEDPRVRRAFAMAIDRRTLAGMVEMGNVSPASGGFVPPGLPGHVPGIALPYDLESARSLLAEAGYPNGQGIAPVKVLFWDLLANLCDFFETLWQDGLGVEIIWELLEFGDRYRQIYEDPPAIFWAGWLADYPDPDSFLRVGVHHMVKWRDEAYDRLVEEAGQTMDQEVRMELYRQAELILVDKTPVFPLAYQRCNRIVKPWVKNYQPGIGSDNWKDVIIEPH